MKLFAPVVAVSSDEADEEDAVSLEEADRYCSGRCLGQGLRRDGDSSSEGDSKDKGWYKLDGVDAISRLVYVSGWKGDVLRCN